MYTGPGSGAVRHETAAEKSRPSTEERMSLAMRIARNQRGQGMTEYIIIAILVALVVMFTVNRFGKTIRDRFGAAEDAIGGLDIPTEDEEE